MESLLPTETTVSRATETGGEEGHEVHCGVVHLFTQCFGSFLTHAACTAGYLRCGDEDAGRQCFYLLLKARLRLFFFNSCDLHLLFQNECSPLWLVVEVEQVDALSFVRSNPDWQS